MPNETAMLLTQQEWEDLAYICRAYEQSVRIMEPVNQRERRVVLAKRVIDAAAN